MLPFETANIEQNNMYDWLFTVLLSIWGLLCAMLDPGIILTVLSIVLVLLKVLHEILTIKTTIKKLKSGKKQ